MRATAALLLVTLAAAAGCSRGPASPPEILGEINNEYLTADEYLHHFKARGGLTLGGAARDELKRMLLAELVDRRLLLSEARRRRIRPAREEVRREFGRLGGAGWEQAERTAAWNAQDDLYEQRQIEELLRAALSPPAPPGRDAIAAWVRAHPEARRRPAQVKLRQLVVHSSAMAAQLKTLLEQGGTPAAAARRFGLPEPDSAWLGEDGLPAAVWAAAAGAKTGAVVGPVATEYGFHVGRVEGRRDGGTLSAEEAGDLARRRLLRDRRDEAQRAYVARLRRAAAIRVDRAALDRL